MSRKVTTNGIYKINCSLTGEPVGTTPQVFEARAKRNGVDVNKLKEGYIGRTGAKLLTTLVNEKGVKVQDAIKQIRTEFEVKTTTGIDQKIIDRVINKVTAKAKAAKDGAEFEARKAKALAKLIGAPAATPAPKAAATPEATKPTPAPAK